MSIPLANPAQPLEPNSWRILHALDRHLVSNKAPNVADPVPDHRRSFKTDTPPVDMDIFWESHRFQHFRSEHSTVSDLDPFLELGVESENLERGLRVWVVGGFEPEVFYAHFLEEDSHEPYEKGLGLGERATGPLNPTNKIGERQVPISDDTLDLMKLRQMGRIHCLVPEHPVDAEQLGRPEHVLCLRRSHLASNHALCFFVKVLPSAFGGEFPQHRG